MEISDNRYRSLLAAKATCQALRRDISDCGGLTNQTMAHHDKWMRLTEKIKYEHPKQVSPTWCCQCQCRHVYGKHKQ